MTRTTPPSGPNPASSLRHPAALFAVAVLVPALVAVGVVPGTAPAAALGATAAPATPASASATPPAAATPGRGVVIAELANGGTGSRSDSFFELENTGDEPVDLTGWEVARCSAQGLRANTGRSEADLTGVVLAPGERLLVARTGSDLGGAQPDAVFTQPFADAGFGLLLLDPSDGIADAVAVYPTEPWPTTSECSLHGNLPNALAAALGESWQRVSRTGDARADFVRARATPGAANVTAPNDLDVDPARGFVDPPVRIAEVAAAGPGSGDDEFVELVATTAPVDLSGWRLLTCGPTGRVPADRPATVFDDGTRLEPGRRLVVATSGADVESDATTRLGLDARGFGVLLADDEGRRVDGMAASAYGDSACQSGDEKLGVLVDGRTGESWQRVGPGRGSTAWSVAPRTPGAVNATTARSILDDGFAYPSAPDVVITELATDPADLPAGYERRNFVELANLGDTAVDVSGWQLVRCTAAGARALSGGETIPHGTTLAPGATWTAALVGTPLAGAADVVVDEGFDFRGTGVWLSDASGRRVDSVGVYRANEMDFSVERPSPCTKGLSLVTFEPDRARAETYQRSAFTGNDADDFVVAPASPGVGRPVAVPDPIVAARRGAEREVARTVAAQESAERRRAARPAALVDPGGVEGVEPGAEPGGEPATELALLGAWRGASDEPLRERSGVGESVLATAGATGAEVRDDGFVLPYLRLRVASADAALPLDAGVHVGWRGSAEPRTAVRLSTWRESDRAWHPLDERTAGDDGRVELAGTIAADDLGAEASVDLLVQVVPRATTLRHADAGGFDDAAEYDLAISHLTDTQYLAEAYPETYAEVVSWVAANAGLREIAFATHTGDLVQNWVNPDQSEAVARREFETASRMQAVLDDAGVPNSVLPGNHDTKRGTTSDLFNEYFPPSRYSSEPWYGGSIAPDDQTANFSRFERAGAKFLMLSLPYAYGEREIAWAEAVVAAHPDRNVVLSTHEHVTPKEVDESARRSTSSRWLSRADELWERVIAPNRNVVLVLSGHFHGLGAIVTEDAGGLPGHTVTELVADYQEFRTHDGARATGFQRLLQVDLAGGTIGVDAYSSGLDAHASHPYDYVQFDPERGDAEGISEMRPWNIVERGVQGRYTAADDEFAVGSVRFAYAKSLTTEAVVATRSGGAAPAR
ncbi:lamin tail domain-containing protein [Agromyces agglutinans]|uniref:lamin tail domain-containing protein n=1 Tax=Agromyces agglutinans TaxID=2662258 RepID=UPI001299C851|nr:lamin tail domain-containing protein [Agromyces agglutinans]